MKQRNTTIELIRIIATLLVIALHTTSWYVSGDKIIPNRALVYSYLQDAVPLFWYITGMFLFNPQNTFTQQIKRTFWKIVLPPLVLVLFVALFSSWLQGYSSFIYCIFNPSINFAEIIGSIFRWSTAGIPLSGHLWFIFSYVKVILWFPLLQHVCSDDEKSNKYRHYIIVLAIIAELINDFQQFGTLKIGKITPYTILDPSLLYVVLGYELMTKKEVINQNKNKTRFIGLFVFLIGNAMRYFITANFFANGIKNTSFMHIENVLSVITSLALFLFLLTIEFHNEKLKTIICKLAAFSFPIYLLHRAVYTKLNSLGIRPTIYQNADKGLIQLIVSVVIYTIIVYIASLFLAFLIRFCKNIVKKILI